MEKDDKWGPETKLGPFMAPTCTQIIPNDTTTGKLSVVPVYYTPFQQSHHH